MNIREAHKKKIVWKLASGIYSFSEAGAIADLRKQMGPDIEPPIHDGMMSAIAVLYSRPFTSNKGVGMVSQNFVKSSSAESKAIHALLWQHRNISAAHSDPTIGIEGSEEFLRDLTITATKLPAGRVAFGYKLPYIKIPFESIDRIINLIGEMIEKFNVEMDAALGELCWDESNSRPTDLVPDMSNLDFGKSVSFPLNLHDAVK